MTAQIIFFFFFFFGHTHNQIQRHAAADCRAEIAKKGIHFLPVSGKLAIEWQDSTKYIHFLPSPLILFPSPSPSHIYMHVHTHTQFTYKYTYYRCTYKHVSLSTCVPYIHAKTMSLLQLDVSNCHTHYQSVPIAVGAGH